MPKPQPSQALKAMLAERDIALWDAYHYKDYRSTSKYATTKDPVSVVLKIPEAPDMNFHGHGDNLDAAVANALAFSYNLPLRLREKELAGAMARLESELHETWRSLWEQRCADLDLADDVPF